MDVQEFLTKMSSYPHVSGYESELAGFIKDVFAKYTQSSIDKFGNVIANKPSLTSTGQNTKIMFCAHMDENGLMVADIADDGFVKFSPVGGMDKRTMLAQEVTIHGREKVYGVIGTKPPHLTDPKERSKSIEFHDMAIDTGFSKEKLSQIIRPGDIITMNQGISELQNKKLTGRSLDNIVGVAALYCAMKSLEHFNHNADLYFVASAQEEVGKGGARTATYTIKPDIGIAVDVGQGRIPGLAEYEAFELGKGPVLGIGPNFNRKLFDDLKKVATKNNAKYQVEVIPFMSGTDATDIQISGDGVITGLMSIPLKYMHSTVETVAVSDIESCGKLMADYIIECMADDRIGVVES